MERWRRIGAYGLCRERDIMLLARAAAEGDLPGVWQLPGGGTDHGEQPVTGPLRELVEEAGQLGRVAELLEVDSAHNPALLGPEGCPVDWHTG